MIDTLELPEKIQAEIRAELFKIEMVKIHNDFIAMRMFGETVDHSDIKRNVPVKGQK